MFKLKLKECFWVDLQVGKILWFTENLNLSNTKTSTSAEHKQQKMKEEAREGGGAVLGDGVRAMWSWGNASKSH